MRASPSFLLALYEPNKVLSLINPLKPFSLAMWDKQLLLEFGFTTLGWYRHHIFFTKAALFISGLVACHAFVEYAVVGVFITYLKQEWDRNLPEAAEIANIQDGLSTVLKIVLAFVSDAFTGRFNMVVYSTAVYIVGLVILCIAAWLPINKMTILWVALVLISIGKAGRSAPLKAFLADQLWSDEITPREAEEQKESRQNVWWNISWFLGSIIALFSAVSWGILCLTSASAIFAAWLCFLSGFAFYYCIIPTGSPLSKVFHVVKLTVLKRQLSYPFSPSQFYRNDGDQILLSPVIPFFRWLDKAAIVELASICPEEQEKEGKLCSVAEVEEVKLLLTMIPMWTTFLAYSIVDSLGSTFFLEQADSMDAHLGIITKVPTEFLLMIKPLISFLVSYFYRRNNRHVRTMIGLGMMWATLSCCVATIVELHREDDSSVFSLIPQFICLGLMEGFAINGVNEFFDSHVSESMRIYGPEFTDCVLGIGKFMTVIVILICKDWFGENVNSSHLDRFFGMVAMLNVLNLIAFGFIASKYGGNSLTKESELKEVTLGRSCRLLKHWRNNIDRFWSRCSTPNESEKLLGLRQEKKLNRLITAAGCGTELYNRIFNQEDEQSCQQRTACRERQLHRSFTAIGCETNEDEGGTRREYRFAPESCLDASILMSKGWGPGANYSIYVLPKHMETAW